MLTSDKALRLLEPKVGKNTSSLSTDQRIQLSIAVSLRRIADKLGKEKTYGKNALHD